MCRPACDARPKAATTERTNDLLVSDVIRSNELQVWFVGEHGFEMPLVQPCNPHAAMDRTPIACRSDERAVNSAKILMARRTS